MQLRQLSFALGPLIHPSSAAVLPLMATYRIARATGAPPALNIATHCRAKERSSLTAAVHP